MSGIFGIIRRDGGPVTSSDLERLGAAMAHRGPDGSDTWQGGCAGLGQLMLRSTPEAADEQLPWQDPESGLVITADARIDNRKELLAKLNGTSTCMSDSRLILEAYKCWGEACVDHLLGDYAFAIWGPRDGRLFCVRDRMGGRSFCYVDRQDFLAFASEAEALLRLPGVPWQPNEDRIANVLVPAFENRGDERTWQSSVLALMPAHLLTVTIHGRAQKRRYWEPDFTDQTSYSSLPECQEHFLAVFGEAVRCRMRVPGNLAAMMSGGLDSAGIAAMIRRMSAAGDGNKVHTYSALDDDLEGSVESRSIQSIVGCIGARAHQVSVPSFDGMVNLEDVLEAAWQRAHPVDNTLLLPAMMCLAASRDGNRVILDGACGDITTRSARLYPARLMTQGRWLEAYRECVNAADHHVYLQGLSAFSLFKQNAWRAFAPRPLKRARFRAQRPDPTELLERSLLKADFAERQNLADRIEEQCRQDESRRLAGLDYLFEQRSADYILSGLSGYERVASRYGVEARDPWADVRVVEFFSRLPVEFLVRDGWTKYLVRTSFEQELAPGVLWRHDKEHLGWKFTRRVMDASRPLLAKTMDRELDELADVVDLDAARAEYRRWESADGAAAREAVYELATLTRWLYRTKSL
jgi:asparagine synthase (glutamine-hydrolysing)